MRIARIAQLQGWRFPRFASDDVTQWLIEEALLTRLDAEDHAMREREEQLADAHRQARTALAGMG